jgi:hypothetical protein
MHVQYVAVCDHVLVGADGKPSLIGVFSDIQAVQVPVTLPRLAFAARLLLTGDETGRNYKAEVVIKDPKGEEIARPGGEINVPQVPAGIDSLAIDLPMIFDMFGLNEFGRYTFLLEIDGEPKAAVQIAVRQGQPQGPMA